LPAVRNGENITILTDREEGPHPMHWKMARRPDRMMEKRWDKNYFPYDLLDLEPIKDEEGNIKGYNPGKHEGLVPYNLDAANIALIASLAPAEFMWLSLMLERIQKRFGKDNFAPWKMFTEENDHP
jgi:hypothetical protein